MHDLERRNQRAIDALNQRGGRMLGLTDLLAAGTVGLEMAAEMACACARGGSFLTAAGPGGVGKTTLMGALLAFLPPGTEIIPIEGPETLRRLTAQRPPPDRPQCLVVHEIGAGRYYGYLWGAAVARYFALAGAPGRSFASNLHAETYQEALAQLTGPPLGVRPAHLARVDLMAFMARARGKRRVTEVWQADGSGGHARRWRWHADGDRFERVGDGPAGARQEEVARVARFLERALCDGCLRMEDLRRRALADLFGQPTDQLTND
jgi:hypothetical protein